MEKHEKRLGYPRTAYEFFLKLYCKKRDKCSRKDRNTSLAAIKAWVTLSEEEKKFFTAKYNECKMKHIAVHLEKMEPYMKKKPIKRLQVNLSDCKSLENKGCSVQEDTQITDRIIDKNLNTTNVNFAPPAISNIQEQHNNTKSEDVEEYEVPIVSEPSPPIVRNSVDLFNLIQNKNGERNSEWSALSKAEKNRYRKAVYQLKNDYIKKYKIYLESLPSKELFKYYHKFDENE